MSTMYSTITVKGQVTLPARLRRSLGFRPGLKVAIRQEGDTIVLGPVQVMQDLREQARAEMVASGTWGAAVAPDQGWAAAASGKVNSSVEADEALVQSN